MATTLTSSAPPLVSSHHANEEKGFLVVETNYRVYAYTSTACLSYLIRNTVPILTPPFPTGNPLQIAVINLFVTLKTRFPNLVVGQLTRESVKSALNNGITADQIVSYFTAHAHPQMRKQVRFPHDPTLTITTSHQCFRTPSCRRLSPIKCACGRTKSSEFRTMTGIFMSISHPLQTSSSSEITQLNLESSSGKPVQHCHLPHVGSSL